MRYGFRPLINPGVRVSEVDLDASRAQRERFHQEVRIRQHIIWLFSNSTPGDGLVSVTPHEISDLPEEDQNSLAEPVGLSGSSVEEPA